MVNIPVILIYVLARNLISGLVLTSNTSDSTSDSCSYYLFTAPSNCCLVIITFMHIYVVVTYGYFSLWIKDKGPLCSG